MIDNIFYGSFFEASKCLKKKQGKYLVKLLNFMTYKIDPCFSEKEIIEKALFLLMRIQIEANWNKRECGKKGGRPEVSDKIKDAIVEDLNNGITQKDIAEKYDIAQSTVSGIKKQFFENIDENIDENIENLKGQYRKPNENENDIPQPLAADDSPSVSLPKKLKKESSLEKDLPHEAVELAELLYSEHKKLDPAYSVPDKHIHAWAKDIEKLNRIDGRAYVDIQAVILWVKTDGNFWLTNIMSGATLRKQFSRIFLEMQSGNRSPPNKKAKYDFNVTGSNNSSDMPF